MDNDLRQTLTPDTYRLRITTDTTLSETVIRGAHSALIKYRDAVKRFGADSVDIRRDRHQITLCVD